MIGDKVRGHNKVKSVIIYDLFFIYLFEIYIVFSQS